MLGFQNVKHFGVLIVYEQFSPWDMWKVTVFDRDGCTLVGTDLY